MKFVFYVMGIKVFKNRENYCSNKKDWFYGLFYLAKLRGYILNDICCWIFRRNIVLWYNKINQKQKYIKEKLMNIFITNDDGINAEGIKILAQEISKIAISSLIISMESVALIAFTFFSCSS